MKQEDIREKIKEIIGEIQCPREFCCLDVGFDKSCKVKDVGLEQYLECLEETPHHCQFSVSYGSKHYCSCPLRVYMYKKLGNADK